LLGTKGAGRRGTSTHRHMENKDIRHAPKLPPHLSYRQPVYSGEEMAEMQGRLWRERNEAEETEYMSKGHRLRLSGAAVQEGRLVDQPAGEASSIKGLGLTPWRQTGRPRPPRRVIEPAITLPGEEVTVGP